MPAEKIDTLVIGGGQAGLAMSYRLKQRGLSHLVLERGRIAERWRSERWDGLKFQFPNWSVRLPDFPLRYTDPDGFASSADIIALIEAYADFVAPPIRCGVAVSRLRRNGASGFVAETSEGEFEAKNVVIATGPYQRPFMPGTLRDENIFQVHASGYKNPDQLPPGAVLVAGAGASGAQIADELFRAGRRVFLSVGQHRRLPRSYRGRDLAWWFDETGVDDVPVELRAGSRLPPVLTGAYGGYTIDFRRFAADGIILLGRVQAARDGVIDIAADLAESLATGDTGYTTFLDMIDAHIGRRGLRYPKDPVARATLPDPAPACVAEPLRRLDLRTEGIGAVIWATGYGLDFGWIEIPAFDARGQPLHRHGVSEIQGLYFLGLQWLSRLKSAFLSGVGDDAAVLADHIVAARG